MNVFFCMMLIIVTAAPVDELIKNELDTLKTKLSHLEQHTQTLEHHIRIPLVHEGLLFESVHSVLKKRLPPSCTYEVLSGHPENIVVNGDRVIIHLINAKSWATNSKYPHCTSPSHSIFLKSLQPNNCLSAVDFEWVECGGGIRDGKEVIKEHPWKGQTYLFFCRESPQDIKPPKLHWIDGGNGLCAVFPTNWVPPLPFFLEVEPITIEKKKEHELVTSAISHSFTALRSDLTLALIRRNISFHRFGSQMRSISMSDYLKSFQSAPHIKPTELEDKMQRIEKEDAIRWSKFHIAVEHASQNGYMSEKIWQCLRVGTVPIYYGAPEARFFLPPHSTIFMSDFSSYDALIDHLLYLDKNDTAYLEYLNWRSDLKKPNHPYTAFLSSYGQGEMFSQHFCLVDAVGSSVLEQIDAGKEVLPFRQSWTDWVSGQSCYIPDHGCMHRKDLRDPPTEFICSGTPFSLKPYSFP